MLLGSTITDESGKQAMLIALHPKPALNRVAQKSIPFATVASNLPSPLDWQFVSQCLRAVTSGGGSQELLPDFVIHMGW